MSERTYTVTVTFTVNDRTDEHLQNKRAIRGEVQSWLESLNATVHNINVTAEKERNT